MGMEMTLFWECWTFFLFGMCQVLRKLNKGTCPSIINASGPAFIDHRTHFQSMYSSLYRQRYASSCLPLVDVWQWWTNLYSYPKCSCESIFAKLQVPSTFISQRAKGDGLWILSQRYGCTIHSTHKWWISHNCAIQPVTHYHICLENIHGQVVIWVTANWKRFISCEMLTLMKSF